MARRLLPQDAGQPRRRSGAHWQAQDALAAVAHNAGWTGAGFRAAWRPRAAPARQDACGQQRVMSEAADSPVSRCRERDPARGLARRHGDGGCSGRAEPQARRGGAAARLLASLVRGRQPAHASARQEAERVRSEPGAERRRAGQPGGSRRGACRAAQRSRRSGAVERSHASAVTAVSARLLSLGLAKRPVRRRLQRSSAAPRGFRSCAARRLLASAGGALCARWRR